MPHPKKQKSHSSRCSLGPIHSRGVRGHPHVHLMHGCLPFDLWRSHFSPKYYHLYESTTNEEFCCSKQLSLSFFKMEATLVLIHCSMGFFPLLFPFLILKSINRNNKHHSNKQLLNSNKSSKLLRRKGFHHVHKSGGMYPIE